MAGHSGVKVNLGTPSHTKIAGIYGSGFHPKNWVLYSYTSSYYRSWLITKKPWLNCRHLRMIIPVWTSFQETTMLVHGSNPCNSMATCLDPAPKTVSTTNCRLKKWPVWYLEAPLELELVKYVKFSVVFYLWFYTWEIPIRKNHWDLQRHSPAPSEGSSGLWAPPATTTGRIIGGIGAKRSCPRKQNLTFWKKSRNIYIYYNIL